MDVGSIYSTYFGDLKKIVEEKQFPNNVKEMLYSWFLILINSYKKENNVLDNETLEEYITNRLSLLKKVNNLTIYSLEEIIADKTCPLFDDIKKVPEDISEYNVKRLKKEGDTFSLDQNGNYCLTTMGVCDRNNNISLFLEDVDYTFQHELEHIDRGFIYPYEFPFAKDIEIAFSEGDAEYQRYLVKYSSLPKYHINSDTSEYIVYYQLYTTFMLLFPKESRYYWRNKDQNPIFPDYFLKVFENIIKTEQDRKNFANIIALVTLIVESYNKENTKNVAEESIKECYKYCSKQIRNYNKSIAEILEKDREINKKYIEEQSLILQDMMNQIQNPNLLNKEYLNIIEEEKEYIESEPQENQEELLKKLESYTLEDYKKQLLDDISICKQNIENCNKERTKEEILGEFNYNLYNFYQLGELLSLEMKQILSENLTVEELYYLLLKKVEEMLMKKEKSESIEQKLAFIEPSIKAYEESRKFGG